MISEDKHGGNEQNDGREGEEDDGGQSLRQTEPENDRLSDGARLGRGRVGGIKAVIHDH